MDALSSLFPMHQIGSDGFAWWIGQVESSTYRSDGGKDPKRSGMILIIAWQSRINGGRLTSQNMFPLEAVELYWHFVDGIWVILFIILYLL